MIKVCVLPFSKSSVTWWLTHCNREDEDVWNQGRIALKKTTPEGAPELTTPKPDVYLALPINPRRQNPRGFHKDDYIQLFGEESSGLFEGHKKELISNPVVSVESMVHTKSTANHLVCFPSAVVEIKHHNVPQPQRERCYCQAANGAAAALSILHKLTIHSRSEAPHREIRPVVAFTFIGPESRVWIAFITKRAPSTTKGGKRLKWKICKYVSQILRSLTGCVLKHQL